MEPERNIEKLLRAYAKKRRDAAGHAPEMHPATRRLLQGEIARRTPREAPGWFSQFFGLPRPGLALGLCFVALSLVVAGLVMPAMIHHKTRSSTLAKNELQESLAGSDALRKDRPAERATAPLEERQAMTPAPAVSTAPANSVALNYDFAGRESVVTDRASLKEAPLGTPATVEVARDKESAMSRSENSKVATSGALTAGGAAGPSTLNAESEDVSRTLTPKSEVAAPSDTKSGDRSGSFAFGGKSDVSATNTRGFNEVELAKAEPKVQEAFTTDSTSSLPPGSFHLDDLGAGRSRLQAGTDGQTASYANSQRYVQAQDLADAREMKKAAVAAASQISTVLNAFSLEQNGAEIQVIDSDGSVYRGTLQWTGAADESLPGTNQVGGLSNAPAVQNAATVATQNYVVSWSGVNRSLNQNVTFNGSLQSVGAAPALQKENGVTGNVQGKFQAAQNDLSQLPLANSRINGTAVINNKEQIQVNAVSATVPGP